MYVKLVPYKIQSMCQFASYPVFILTDKAYKASVIGNEWFMFTVVFAVTVVFFYNK